MTTPTTQELADLFLPLRARMEKAGCWPERSQIGDKPPCPLPLVFYSEGKQAGYWWCDYCNKPDAANALLVAGLGWLMDRGCSLHRWNGTSKVRMRKTRTGTEKDTDLLYTWTTSEPTDWHAIAAALAATLPETP